MHPLAVLTRDRLENKGDPAIRAVVMMALIILILLVRSMCLALCFLKYTMSIGQTAYSFVHSENFQASWLISRGRMCPCPSTSLTGEISEGRGVGCSFHFYGLWFSSMDPGSSASLLKH